MNRVKVDYYARDQRRGAVLSGSHAAHAVVIDLERLRRGARTRIGEIEQNAVRILRGIDGGRHGSAERDLHANIGALTSDSDVLHRRAAGVLCGHAGGEQPYGPKMSANCLHSVSTLAGAPPAGVKFGVTAVTDDRRIRLSSALAAGMALITIDAVVDVTSYALMVRIGLRRTVAIRALKH